MSSKSSAIGKGILVGAAAGAALYVMWRRARERREVYEPPVQAPGRHAEPQRQPEPAPEPAHEAPMAPVAAVEPEPEPEPAAEPEPQAVSQPEPEREAVAEPEPVAGQPPEPAFELTAPAAHPPPAPVAEHGARRQGLTYTGRPRDLSPAGWPQPMPLATTGGVRRPVPVSARATWPGVAAAGQMRPTPFRRIAPRGGGGPLHRAG
jgi:outer membrane biosynthesis protein TonB